MKAKRKTRAPRQAAKKTVKKMVKSPARNPAREIVQFAPSFTVHVLPPLSICLYAEHRKFFLHGELYVAIAEAIGKNGKETQLLIRELSKKFPIDQIQEALKRLYDRQYVTIASPATTGILAGFWSSIGLPPEVAENTLANCRVRIEAIDVDGAKELTAALTNLGVRIVTRSPDLTVTLVNDYLDHRLAKLNNDHVAGKTPWILAQPSGAFPLVGPVFKPGETACWTCLADRMIRNREIKGFLDRAEGGRVVAESPLLRGTFGQSAIQFAAVEIAKAIASSFRTDLRDHIASFDLMGATIAKHFVAHRPQCPVCGDKKFQNPRRAPKPVEIHAGTRLIMTSGGYRSVSSRTTVARYRKHVSPLTGVVTRLEKMDGDLPLNTNFFAQHNFSAPAQSVDELRSGLNGGSSGKGSTAEQAEASALMEAIERYSGIFQGDEIRTPRKRFADFPKGDAILSNDVQHFSEAQFASRLEHHQHGDDGHPVPDPIDPDAKIEWSPAWSLRDQRFRYFPTGLLYFFYEDFHTDSNGCAAGNSREEAIVQGFLELVERDAYAIWWYNRLRRSEVDLSEFDDAYIRDIKSQFADHGRRIWVLDITSDLGVPTYVAMMHWIEDGKENIEFGSGAHFDRRIALLRSLTELSQFLSIGEGGLRGDRSTLDGVTPLKVENYPFLLPADHPVKTPELGMNVPLDSVKEQVEACVEVARRAGYDFLVLDQTRPDVEVPVVRVIVPGLRHFYKRFGPGRLYDVPVKMGWLDQPRREDELTPFLPHT
jgi:ribosomal protein S12 methylthiotransferase accessory factor